MKRAGRKNKYETHVKPYLDKIPQWRRNGMLEEEIAQKLGIGYSTLSLYKEMHIELLEALKTGKAELIEKLKESLFTRAMGVEVEETKTIIEKDERGKDKKRVEKTKKIVASDTCLIFALKNLDPENFRDRREVKQDINATVQNLVIDIVDDNDNLIDLDDWEDDLNEN